MRVHAAGVAFALGTAGCVLLVSSPPEGLGSECRFSGEIISACGRCVAASCVDSLNACCGDSSCEDTMSLLDSCAKESVECTSLIDKTLASSPSGEALASCVKKKCSDECSESGNTVDGGAEESSDGKIYVTKCSQFDDSCSCSVPAAGSDFSTPNSTPCGTATFENALCCAEAGWPAAETRCSCSQVTCVEIGATCECSTSANGSLSTCGEDKYSHCCLNSAGTACKCGSATACPSYETEVTSCTTDSLGCTTGYSWQNACALYNDKN